MVETVVGKVFYLLEIPNYSHLYQSYNHNNLKAFMPEQK